MRPGVVRGRLGESAKRCGSLFVSLFAAVGLAQQIEDGRRGLLASQVLKSRDRVGVVARADIELRQKDDCGRGIGNELSNLLERRSRLLGLAEANVHLDEPQSSRCHSRPPLDDVFNGGDRFTEPRGSFRLFSAQAVYVRHDLKCFWVLWVLPQ